MKKILKIGILSKEAYQRRTIAIANGSYRPQPDEPKIWFESIKSMAQVLSKENQILLQIIMDRHPQSLQELAQVSGRQSSNVSRTLHTLARYDIVKLTKNKKKIFPTVLATDFKVEFGLERIS